MLLSNFFLVENNPKKQAWLFMFVVCSEWKNSSVHNAAVL